MKTTNLFRYFTLVVITFFGVIMAHAAPTVDSVIVQGYIKEASGAAVPDGTYSFDVGVVQGTTTIWAKHFTTVGVASGLFSVTLKGLGDNIGTGTAFDPVSNTGDFSAITFTPAYLNGQTLATTIRIYSNTAVDGVNPQFDFSTGSTPTAFIADTANNLANGVLGLAAFGTSAYNNAGPATPNQLIVANSSGLVDLTLIPTIPANHVSGLPASTGNNSYTGNQSITGNLAVTGTTSFTGPVSISSDETVGGNVYVTGTSAFTGASLFNGAMVVNGTGWGLQVSNDSVFNGAAAVVGTSSFGGNSNFGNNLNVAGTTSLGILVASGSASIAGTLTNTGLITANGSPNSITAAGIVQSVGLTSTGFNSLANTTISGNLAVSGTSGNLAVSGTSTFSGPIVLSNAGTTGQALTWNGATNAPQWSNKIGGINIVTISTTGTYTPSANLMYAMVEVVGGGASGGGWITSAKNAGGGGGGGGYIKAICTAAQIGASQAVTVGTAVTGTAGAAGTAGNQSRFGTASIKLDGNGGSAGAVGVSAINVVGGAGGTGANTGAVCTTIATIPGQNGSPSFAPSAANLGFGGTGGSSSLGPGGIAVFGATTVTGSTPTGGFGGGGGGAYNGSSAATTGAGGAGTAGVVIVTEYLY